MARSTTTTTPAPTLSASADWSNRRVVQILEAAGRCFARAGYTETSVQEIADTVGLRKSAVHYYFESKAQLLHEVLTYTYKRHLDRVTMRLQLQGQGAANRARQALKTLWDTVRQEQRFFRLSLEFWAVAARDAKLRERLQQTHRAARQAIADGIADALGPDRQRLPFSPEALSALILAVLHGLEVQQYAEPEGVDVDEAFRVFLAAMLAGLAALGLGR